MDLSFVSTFGDFGNVDLRVGLFIWTLSSFKRCAMIEFKSWSPSVLLLR